MLPVASAPAAAPAPAPTLSSKESPAQANPAARISAQPKNAPVMGPIKKDYSKLGAEEWASMTLEEQEEAMRQINAELDDDMGEEPD